jgi:hypothetical protein
MKNQKSLRNNDTTRHFRIFTDEKARELVKQGKIIGINEIKLHDLSLSIVDILPLAKARGFRV